MDIQQLRHFLAVAETGSFAAAADTMALTQSGLSRSILALERAVALPLFERRPRGVILTEYGRELLPRARAILNERDRALKELRAYGDMSLGSLTIGLMPTFNYTLAPALAGALLERSDGIEVRMVIASHDELLERLVGAELHCAIVLAVTPGHPDLVYGKLHPARTAVFASPRHPLTRRRRLQTRDLVSAAWALTDSPSLRSAFDGHFRAEGLAPPPVRLVCPSISLLVQSMQQASLLTVLPQDLASAELFSPYLGELAVPAPASTASAWLVTRRSHQAGPALKLALQVLRDLRSSGMDDETA